MAGDVEVRGFALMLAVRVAYLAFLLWLFIPEAYLQELGITYYPSKYWAVAGPAWLTLAIVWGYWVYEGLNMTRVPPLSDSRNLADARCKSAERVGLRGYTQPTTHAVPPLCHIPPDIVSRHLFGGGAVASTPATATAAAAAAAEASVPATGGTSASR
ncbi:hypothetical protein CHLRE_01g055424v5 [Chlamydomonas reinhardtii]|uniref:PIG-P domain-containing protein n=1 Tax=Chlamydomonas reinhardtii TaxID=3055 RepID=A0A2K3E8C6_CHLRE|nr:uncharacterized protein CHLRE_01g055424v5 [Chlamydomonas reinhardtii]PNW89035.1 hypothetical protein CHLRE_01g055424v5 [Chlamydomonas reinhardtii]